MRRVGLLAAMLVVALAGVAQASGPVATVTGKYTYFIAGDPGNARAVSVHAVGTDPVRGTWEWQQLVAGAAHLRGTVTCLIVDGPDAWLAGPVSRGGEAAGAFLWVHDGGMPHGADDSAITWVADPGDTLEDMETLCETKATTISRFPVVSGNLVVRPSR